MSQRERKAMDDARRECLEENLQSALGVSSEDARNFFEDGWKAAIEWVRGQKR